jgi:hypothetical protein
MVASRLVLDFDQRGMGFVRRQCGLAVPRLGGVVGAVLYGRSVGWNLSQKASHNGAFEPIVAAVGFWR